MRRGEYLEINVRRDSETKSSGVRDEGGDVLRRSAHVKHASRQV